MKKNEGGFTLIELMIATALVSIIVAVIYSAYNVQTKIYTEQDKTAEMQQNIRAGMVRLQHDLRMAGYNSLHASGAACGGLNKPGIHNATAPTIGFSMDMNNDGDCADSGENITYSLYTDADGIKKLGRAAPVANQPVAENIAEMDFLYLLQDSGGNRTQSRTPGGADLENIVGVQVSLLARARDDDRKTPAASSFTLAIPPWGAATPAKTWAFNDSNRYRLLTTIINCRNLGLLK